MDARIVYLTGKQLYINTHQKVILLPYLINTDLLACWGSFSVLPVTLTWRFTRLGPSFSPHHTNTLYSSSIYSPLLFIALHRVYLVLEYLHLPSLCVSIFCIPSSSVFQLYMYVYPPYVSLHHVYVSKCILLLFVLIIEES